MREHHMMPLTTEQPLVPVILTTSLPLVGSATHVRETEAQRAAPSGSKSLALTYALCLF